MFKNVIINKFLAIFNNLKQQEKNDENGIFIRVNSQNELEAYLFKNGKKDRLLAIEDLLNLMK